MGHNFNFISCWGGHYPPQAPPPSATGLIEINGNFAYIIESLPFNEKTKFGRILKDLKDFKDKLKESFLTNSPKLRIDPCKIPGVSIEILKLSTWKGRY